MNNNDVERENTAKLKSILSTLPPFVNDYFTARRSNTTTRTRVSYAYDLRKFLCWLHQSVPELREKDVKEISIENLAKITARDIEEYTDFLLSDLESPNHRAGVARKLASLSSFFDYFYKNDDVPENPCHKVVKPKLEKDNRIIRLAPDEVVVFLNAIEFGCSGFTEKQQKYLENTRLRDLTIATLLLGTGIRVSECAGMNVSDINLDKCKITVYRKGGKYQDLGISDETIGVLKRYLEYREKIISAEPGDKDALFLSLQKRRLCIETIENMIKKYAKAIGLRENITPHKLRKTYGTELYRETNDIYLVAKALGHNNVNTTKNHYAALDEDQLLEARNLIKLR